LAAPSPKNATATQSRPSFFAASAAPHAGGRLAPMIPLEIRSRDGLTLVSYLTLPKGSDADGDGRPDKPLPLVLNVHGGPWARDAYGFDAEH